MAEHMTLTNCTAAPLDAVPVLADDDFRNWLDAEIASGNRVSAFFALPQDGGALLYALVARDEEHTLAIASCRVGSRYPSLTPLMPQVHLFEREIYEETGIEPVGHPWLKPVRFNRPDGPIAGLTDFYRVEGEDVHEVAVGPIHAGIIECGHFRFQCLGELVMHLEISLGYHHRGVASALVNGPDIRTLPIMETVAGDTTIGHAWAYCSTVEALADIRVSPRALAIRAIALELERMANHTGDIGALAGDVGYLPTASYCGRLRGDYLNMSATLCGSRFGRGLLLPGGVSFDLDEAMRRDLLSRLEATTRDVTGASELLWHSASVTARMIGIGTVSAEQARDIGMVGPAARASGLTRDVRLTHPLPGLRSHDTRQVTEGAGDVHARCRMRQREVTASAGFVRRLLENLPEGEMSTVHGREAAHMLAPRSLAVSLVEGWRGEICHVAVTDDEGGLAAYRVVDPSFHNWFGLALALRDQQIADFPLCNKSFNLSYCGHDC